jgi:hypothetical protein
MNTPLASVDWHRLTRFAPRGSETERFLEKHEDAFRWFVIVAVGLLALRFVLENVVG